ncbi:MAG: Hpt domain-containing protein, partial [Cyanobacteria bacterium P01_C01_bin.69]
MPTDPTVSPQTYQYFVQEATELLHTMETELQDLRSDFSLQKVHTLMRAAHTLKGASASVGLETIQKTTHSLEDVFKALCYEDTVVTPEIEHLIFRGYECLQLLMSAQLADAEVDG